MAEFTEGTEGYAFRHEWMFWIFEAAPMLVAILAFCFAHPGAILGRDGGKRAFNLSSGEEESGGSSGSGGRRHRRRRGGGDEEMARYPHRS